MNSEQIKAAAMKAGAARFYPDKQRAHEDCYIVSKQFLERFAAEISQLALAESKIELPDVVSTEIDPTKQASGTIVTTGIVDYD